MSKSLGNCIYLSDTEEELQRKVMSMYTDPNHIRVEDPGCVDGNIVFTYLDAFCKDEHFEKYLPEYNNLAELKDHYKRGGLGDMKIKRFLNDILQEELRPIRERREMLAKNPEKVYEILSLSNFLHKFEFKIIFLNTSLFISISFCIINNLSVNCSISAPIIM